MARALRHRPVAETGAATMPSMSDHTDRLADLGERVSAAKEFL
jgi:hypothetical protein